MRPAGRSDGDGSKRLPSLLALVGLFALAGSPAYAGTDCEGGHCPESTGSSESTGTPESIESNGSRRARRDVPPGRADALHAGITRAVSGTARRIDSFFADDRFYADTTDTYVRVSGQSTWERGEKDRHQAQVRLRLDLPGTSERLRLFVEGDDPDATVDEASSSVGSALEDADYNIGLESQFKNTGKWRIRPGLGVKAGSPVDPFVRVRAIRYAQLNRWLFRFSAGVAEFLDDGTLVFSRADFDRRINQDWLFRSASRIRYRDDKDRIEGQQVLSLFQRLSGRVGMAYEAGMRVDDDPDWEVQNYFTRVRTRVRAYKKWLYVEATPQIIFRERDDYDPSFAFSLRADVIFGERYR